MSYTAEVYRRKKRKRSVFFRIGEWASENRKVLISVIVLIILILLGIWIYRYYTESEKIQEAVAAPEVTVQTMDIELADGIHTIEIPTLEKDTVDVVNQTMKAYYLALQEGDSETITRMRPGTEEVDMLFFTERAKYVEEYRNLSCYTLPGIYEGDYVVFVYADTKLYDIETAAPELNSFYIYPATDGSYLIYESETGRLQDYEAYITAMCGLDEVRDLINKVETTYKEALDADEALNSFLAEFPTTMQETVGMLLAQIAREEAIENGEAPAEGEELLEEPEELNLTEIVRTTVTLNLRKSDSMEAETIIQIPRGTELTRLEEKENGWSLVVYNGQEGYSSSKYLEVVEQVSDVTIIGTVTSTTVVNIRVDASMAAAKIGASSTGQTFQLLAQEGDWCKIIYEDNIAYISSAFVTVDLY